MNLALGLGLASQQRAGAFADPFRSLFRDGGKGALLSAAAPSANYQTDAGVTLAGFGDPVGLALDTKTGLALGPELVDINDLPTPIISDFGDSVGAWDAATRTMSNTVTGSNNTHPRFRFNFGLVAGSRYHVVGRLSGDLTVLNSDFAPIRLAVGGSANNVTYNSTTGVFEARQVSAGAIIEFLMNGTLTAPKSLKIEELSVREIPGAHFSTAVSANRPKRVLVDGVAGWKFDGVSDRLEGNATARDILRNAPGAEAHAAIRWDGGVGWPFAWANTGTAPRFGLRVDADGSLVVLVRRTDGESNTTVSTAAGVITANVKTIVGLSVDYLSGGASAITIWVNGVAITTGALSGTGNSADTQSNLVRIGSNLTDSVFFAGQIFREIPIVARVLGAAERSAMIARLAALTGVTLS